MKKWSYWAKAHPKQARWLILLSSILLSILGYMVGMGLAAFDIEIPLGAILGISVFIFVLISIFPKKSKYHVKRRFHLALGLGAYLAAISLGNLFVYEVNQIPLASSENSPSSYFHQVSQDAPSQLRPSENPLQFGLRDMIQNKKQVKALKKVVKKARDRYRTLRKGWAFLIFLGASIVAYFFTVLIVVLACSAGCSGAAAAANVLAIFAVIFLLGTVFLFVYAIYRLLERVENVRPAQQEPVQQESIPKG